MDADHNHLDIDKFLDKNKLYDLIIGYEETPSRKTKVCRVLVHRLLGIECKHPTCGFRRWKSEVLRNIEWRKVKAKGFDIQIETLFLTNRMDYNIGQILIHPNDRRYDKSKLGLRQIIRWLMMLRRLASKRLYISLVSSIK